MTRYIVLRDQAARRLVGGLEGFGAAVTTTMAGTPTPAPPQPQVEVEDIFLCEAVSANRDPEVAAIAIPMPISLIEPRASDGQNGSADDAWGVAAVQADTSPVTGDGVVVAVLDTGIDKGHRAFQGVDIVENDFTGSGNGDVQGHGSHCAGTIFGRDVGGKRIGVARGVKKALIGKVLDDSGAGSSEMIFRGIQWALNRGAHVISMSLGFNFPGMVREMELSGLPTEPAVSRALESYRSNLRFFDALMQMVKAQEAFQHAALVAAATGNESERNARMPYTIAASLPAAAEGVVSVAALEPGSAGKLGIAEFSNTMAQVAAPGVDILSAKSGGGLQRMSGTSMATPHVAGVAALWWEKLRSSGSIKPTASLVASNIVANARTDVLHENMSPEDRGVGIVTAPQ